MGWPIPSDGIVPIAVGAALVAAAVVLWRGRAARSVERVALWIEERDPRLQYALITGIDAGLAPVDQHAELHAAADKADIEGVVGRAARRLLARAGAACVLSLIALGLAWPRALFKATSARRPTTGAEIANRLTRVTARVVPPAYSRLPDHTIAEPSNVEALIGSAVMLTGRGTADGVMANVDGLSKDAQADHGGWTIGVTMPKAPAVLELRDRNFKRLVALQPVVDSAPVVKLALPLHDTTYQTVPRGKLAVEAGLTDDVGLAYGYVEYMLSTGSEENFETEQVTGRKVAYDNARQGTLRESIDLDTLGLKPGSVLHIRVVAFDYNNVTGPGKGVSETRTLRIAEPVDSASINAAPPLPIDSMWISQRLLNMKTDTLIQHRRVLQQPALVHTSTAYSNAQEDIRQRALLVIAELEDNGVGGSFATDASKMLRTAVDLMWTAREDLAVTHPDSAMPPMKKILAILDELRLAHRYYLRGLLRPVAVNTERVRMTGKDSVAIGTRTARMPIGNVNASLAARIAAAAALAHRTPAAAADSLTFIRVAALSTAPTVGNALGLAIDRLRRGEAADSALTQVRRALAPRASVVGARAPWGGVVP